MQRVLGSVAARVDPSIHPLLAAREPRPDSRTLVIVVTGDKGLCGSFNTNVIKAGGSVHRRRARSRARSASSAARAATSSAAAASTCCSSRSASSRSCGTRTRRRSRRRRSTRSLGGAGRPRGARLQRVQVGHDAAGRRRSAAADRARGRRRRPRPARRRRRQVDYLYEPAPQEIFNAAAAALRRGPGLPRAARVERRVLRGADDGDGHGDARTPRR